MKNIPSVIACWTVLLLAVLSGCSDMPVEDSSKELFPINSIGILPAQPARVTILPSDTKTMEQLTAGASIINSLLSDYFSDKQGVRLISPAKLEGLPSAQSGRAIHLAREAGQLLQYDAVLVTEVAKYQTRTGSAYAVDNPASVSFTLKLLAVASGRVIWSADFDQTQQPLFENILSSRSTGSGFRWLTAAELASAGLKKKLDSCPYL